MDRFLIRLFQSEARMQCQFILLAIEQLKDVEGRLIGYRVHYEREREAAWAEKEAREAAADSEDEKMEARFAFPERLEPLRKAWPRDSSERSWMALQTIAVSAANLSKLFWGSGGGKEDQRKPLRESLGIRDGSCLQSTLLRNSFEHFDERIETRFADASEGVFMGRNIGPIEMVVAGEGQPFQPDSRFGQYDPATGELIFWDKSINVFNIAAEARRILKLAEAESRKPSWVEEVGEGPAAESP